MKKLVKKSCTNKVVKKKENTEDIIAGITKQADVIYRAISKVLNGKNSIAALMVLSGMFCSVCHSVKMTKKDALAKLGETWDAGAVKV